MSRRGYAGMLTQIECKSFKGEKWTITFAPHPEGVQVAIDNKDGLVAVGVEKGPELKIGIALIADALIENGLFPNVGHGWVYPRKDGAVAKCGGPGVCAECTKEAGDMFGKHAMGVANVRANPSPTCGDVQDDLCLVRPGEGQGLGSDDDEADALHMCPGSGKEPDLGYLQRQDKQTATAPRSESRNREALSQESLAQTSGDVDSGSSDDGA